MRALKLIIVIYCLLLCVSCNKSIIVHFSEISQVERLHTNVDCFTEFYAKVNDFNMKIFEAYNNKLSKKGDAKYFARELEFHYSSDFKNIYKYNLPILLKDLKELSLECKSNLTSLFNIGVKSEHASRYIEAAFTERHKDYYKTETYTTTETYTKSDGSTGSRTVIRTRQVYDYSIHEYMFDPTSYNKSVEIIQEVKSIFIPEWVILKHPKVSGADNELAIDRSRLLLDKNVSSRATNYMSFILLPYTRNYYVINQAEIIKRYSKISLPNPGRYIKRRTYSSSDIPPMEWEYAYNISQNLRELSRRIFEIEFSLRVTQVNENFKNIGAFIEQELDAGKNKKIKESFIIDSAKASYNSIIKVK